MNRITITIDDELLGELDQMIAQRGYANRSEAIRDLARAGMKSVSLESGGIDRCIGVLSYVYDHEMRDLARRLTQSHHHHHDISVASLHVHLDADRCLEVSVLKGKTQDVREFADSITAQRSVIHGELAVIPVDDTGHKHHEHD